MGFVRLRLAQGAVCGHTCKALMGLVEAGIGDRDWGLRLGIGIKIGDWELGIGSGIRNGDCHWDWRLGLGIGDWGLGLWIRDWGVEIGMGDWDWGLGSGIVIKIGDSDRGLRFRIGN